MCMSGFWILDVCLVNANGPVVQTRHGSIFTGLKLFLVNSNLTIKTNILNNTTVFSVKKDNKKCFFGSKSAY